MNIDEQEKVQSSYPTSWIMVLFLVAAVLTTTFYLLSTPENPANINKKPLISKPLPEKIEAASPQEAFEALQSTPNDYEPMDDSSLSFDDMQGETSATSIAVSKVGDANELLAAASTTQEETITLNTSDNWISQKVMTYIPQKALYSLLEQADFARKFVVFTDNFAQGIVAHQHSPVVKLKQRFRTEVLSDNSKPLTSIGAVTQGESSNIAPDIIYASSENNAERFDPYIELFLTLDNRKLVNLYNEFLPLFNEAYQELGYEEKRFTEVLKLAIAGVTAFNIPKEALILIQPHVMYKYQNKKIEALPDTEKLLIRIGERNLQALQMKLKALNALF